MKYLAAYMLLSLGGKESPSAEDITDFLTRVGVEVDTQELSFLLSKLEGKSLQELMDAGKERLVSIGGGNATGNPSINAQNDVDSAGADDQVDDGDDAVDMGADGIFGGDDAY